MIGHETATLPAIRGIEPVHARACTTTAAVLLTSTARRPSRAHAPTIDAPTIDGCCCCCCCATWHVGQDTLEYQKVQNRLPEATLGGRRQQLFGEHIRGAREIFNFLDQVRACLCWQCLVAMVASRWLRCCR